MSTEYIPRRGDIVQARTAERADVWAVISNDIRNEETDTFLGARLLAVGGTSPTRVALGDDDPLTGFVSADHLATLHRDQVEDHFGLLAPATLTALTRALRASMP